jgi:predicted amidohydrolase
MVAARRPRCDDASLVEERPHAALAESRPVACESMATVSRPLPIAAVQSAPRPVDAPWQGFAAEVENLVTKLPSTKVVVYPELHLMGDDHLPRQERAERVNSAAIRIDGPELADLAALAGDLDVWLVPGSICERAEDGRVFNTAVLLSSQGKIAAVYRKVFPWRPYEPYHRGNQFVVADLDGVGRVGLSICYDAWFPEHARHLAWMGAEVVLNVVKTTTADRAQELVLARANAITNQVFWVSVNTASPTGRGQSLIVDPEGVVRVEAPSEAPTVLTDVLDLDHVQRTRTYGTAGVTRVWEAFRPGDEPLPLPLYEGQIAPDRWTPYS